MVRGTATAAVIASGVFGGVIGALATAATQSQASPASIAAVVQRVQDQSAERSLQKLSGQLAGLAGGLGALHGDLQALDHLPLFGSDTATFGRMLGTIEHQLNDICRNTEGGSGSFVPCHIADTGTGP